MKNRDLVIQAINTYQTAEKRAFASRDKKIVAKMTKLAQEYDKKQAILTTAAARTMDPKLKKEWMQARKELDRVSKV